jgi:putative Holliday junction resolvase
MKSGRRLAFDYGDVRVGVAISDPSGILATPLATLLNDPIQLIDDLKEIFKEYQPIYIAVGQPKHLSGEASAKEINVAHFVQQLRSISDVPIFGIDERLTTVSANRTLKEQGKDSREARKSVDQVAAAAILESALNQERIQGEPLNRLL